MNNNLFPALPARLPSGDESAGNLYLEYKVRKMNFKWFSRLLLLAF
ncbi:hypothetical protein ACFOEY_05810 [Paracandidimonas soli]